MPTTFKAPPAYPKLHHHPLASAIFAVLGAAVVVAVVTGLGAGSVSAQGPAQVEEELPAEAGESSEAQP